MSASPTVPARLLVTGAQGFLGRHVVGAALSAGSAHVLGVGRSPRDDCRFPHTLEWCGRRVPAPLPADLAGAAADPRYGYRAVDLRDTDAVAELVADFRPDAVVSCAAALRGSPWAELAASNIDATLGLVGGLLATGAPHPALVLVSSGSVYGTGGGVLPLREDGPLHPVDLYGVSKRTAEDAARVLVRDAGLRLVCARVFNIVGPGLDDRHLPARLAGRLGEIARGWSAPVVRLGALDATRDFLDVRDCASALLTLAGTDGAPGIVNVASGVETPVRALVAAAIDAAGLRGTVEVITGPGDGRHGEHSRQGGDISRSVADIARLRRLGVPPGRPVAAAVGTCVDYYGQFPGR